MTTDHWTVQHMPAQHGKLVVITGASSGIGYEAALALAGKGAHVVIAVRNLEKGRAAVARIQRSFPQSQVEVLALNLADLRSVRHFAEVFSARYAALPLLINNAGVMALPYGRTVDGFEMQFGTNYLGHFALTGLLLPLILAAPAARVVSVSSTAHMAGSIDFDNLDGARRYRRWDAYCQSKLANLVFAYELQRRLAAVGADAVSVACHPGWANTALPESSVSLEGMRLQTGLMSFATKLLAQSAAMGALPTLYAATAEQVEGGDYIGPTGRMGMYGYPAKVQSSPNAHDRGLAQRLWQVSERLTDMHYAFSSLEQVVH